MPEFDPNAYGNPCTKKRSIPSINNNSINQTPVEKVQQEDGEDVVAHAAVVDSLEGNEIWAQQTPKGQATYSDHVHQQSSNGLLASKFAPKSAGSKLPDTSLATKPQNQSLRSDSNSKSNVQKRILADDRGKHEALRKDEPNPSRVTLSHECHGDKIERSNYIPSTAMHNSTFSGSEQPANSTVVPTNSEAPKDDAISHDMQAASLVLNPVAQVVPNPKLEDKLRATMEQMLNQAKEVELKKIQARNRTKGRGVTTSPHDLNIARTPTTRANSPRSYSSVRDDLNAQGNTRRSALRHEETPPQKPKDQRSVVQDILRRASRIENQKSGTHASKLGSRPNHQMDQSVRYHTVETASDAAWASENNMKPPEMDADSEAWSSPVLTNASQTSNDSVRAMHAGKVPRRKLFKHSHPLVGWDGAMQPPPPDWDDRPHFDNNSREFRDTFHQWTHDVCQSTIGNGDNAFSRIPHARLADLTEHADGISMVPRETTIGAHNAARYGYDGEDTWDIIKYAQPIDAKDFDKDWGKLDLTKPENDAIKLETTEVLVSNWVQNTAQRRKIADVQIQQQLSDTDAILSTRTNANPNRPMINIYLRPAHELDIPQIKNIYNWWIEHSPRPAETFPICENEMMERLDDVRSDKLPFIVAIEKSVTSTPHRDLGANVEAMKGNPHSMKNVDPSHESIVVQDKIVGWACAVYMTAPDYVERISAELEVYVDPAYRQLGVGRCLMDKLIDACDRGYMKRGGYPFHCPQEMQHLYNQGGGCDLHKLVVIVRKWKFPKDVTSHSVTHRHAKANPRKKPDDSEHDYNIWLKKWLEEWDFEVEGLLKGAGAKNRRFVDIVHFGRETRWQPAEGKIPDPIPRFINDSY